MVRPAALLFTVGCLPARLLLALVVLHWTALPEKAAAALALATAAGFTVIYLLGLRRYGRETFGDPIWWDHLRPLHAAAYAAVAALLWRGHRGSAAAVLFLDAGVGIAAGLHHHRRGHPVLTPSSTPTYRP